MRFGSKEILRLLLALVALSFCALSANAQDTEVRKLLKAASQTSSDVEAEKLLLAAEREAKKLGPENPQLAIVSNHLAMLYSREGRNREAEDFARRALALDEIVLGPEHPRVAADLNILSILLEGGGKNAEAEELMKRALQIAEKAPDPGPYSMIANNLAHLYVREREYAKAEELVQQGLEACRREPRARNNRCATRLRGLLATVYRLQGRNAEAEGLRADMADSAEAAARPQPDEVRSLIRLADQYREQGEYELAEFTYHRAITFLEKTKGQAHPYFIPEVLEALGALYLDEGREYEAEESFKQALEITEKGAGPEHPDLAATLDFYLTYLQNFYRDQGRLQEIEPLYQQILQVQRSVLGSGHRAVAFTLTQLAAVLQEQGKNEEAEPLYREALAIQEKTLGAEHVETLSTLERYADLLQAMDRTAEAAEMAARAQRIREKLDPPQKKD